MSPNDTLAPRPPRPAGTLCRGARAVRGALAAVLGATLVLLGALGTAVPASAHGGPIIISVGTDGAGGVTANLTYQNDGHPVEEAADVTVTAVSEGGEDVGPLALRSASEGVGWYVSDPGVLAEGHWTITATITTPDEATATAEVDVVPLPEPPAPDAGADDAAGTDAGTDAAPAADGEAGTDAAAEDGAGSGTSATLRVVLALAVVAAGALGAVVARRRARTATGASTR